ncbi:hypothetical protein [Shimia sp.]|uniref:hypothetical protein n=1 Tax=Shimia sp. TaxID=1954381 RepID=UPI003B8C8DE7
MSRNARDGLSSHLVTTNEGDTRAEGDVHRDTKFVVSDGGSKDDFDQRKKTLDAATRRRRLWAEQKAAAKLLGNSNISRVKICNKSINYGANGVDVMHSEKFSRFANLTKCGSVWTCPICSRNISNTRRLEANEALRWAKSQKGTITPMMMTLTARHGRDDCIAELVEKMLAAKRLMFQRDKWRRLKARPIWEEELDGEGMPVLVTRYKRQMISEPATVLIGNEVVPLLNKDGEAQIHKYGVSKRHLSPKRNCVGFGSGIILGFLVAFEVVYTANGWHPHFHVLMFLRCSTEKQAKKHVRLEKEWLKCLKAVGLFGSGKGFDFRAANRAEEYITKFGAADGSNTNELELRIQEAERAGEWGLAEELTKTHAKRSKANKTPWMLLEEYAHDSNKQSGKLFFDFANAFYRKQQLQWSQGLKSYLEISEFSDKEAERFGAERALLEEVAFKIRPEDWYQLLRGTSRQERLEILETSEKSSGNAKAIEAKVCELLGRSPTQKTDQS